ncbi:DUF6602 domain-containing protein [Glaciimonas sp. PCH181]|uniref:DUF6602 domain-containing protein n=1 Tax=Glaciimonas sp. PCH181 TaxID=2133943 RepID=UPI000D37038F|nr:DUF6602 domain-containing protein [Glaciimonas sp. PCH181]PUA18622.1 hypothetical protein C7W93_01385 [Glaciimonas sp. PCH181]
MIKNASELLTSFIAAERKNVELINMPHMPTLGSAYEAIANAGIENEFVLPPNLDLRVVSGFIEGIPNQIDGMLVRGEGQRYGLTDQYIYPIEQVLCVLEVKKTLNKSDLIDGIQHLAAVQRLFSQRFSARIEAGEEFDFHLARESYAKLTGRAGPRTDAALDALPAPDRLLFATLARHLYAPVTVLLGFDGYGTEHGLREAMVDIVESNLGNDSDTSPDLLPSLITAGTFSLVKCTGRPYLVSGPKDTWVLLASARHNVARILLEFLWTKISVFCEVCMPFGLDMDHENIKELLLARGACKDERVGFELRSFSYSEKKLRRAAVTVWEPVKLSAGAIALAEFVFFKGGRLELEQSLDNYIQREHCVALDDVVAELVGTSTFCKRENTLQKVTGQALIASFDDGTGYVDMDAARLRAWCDGQGFKPHYMNLIDVG